MTCPPPFEAPRLRASFALLVAAVVLAAADITVVSPVAFRPGDHRRGAAALAAPGLATLPHRPARYEECRYGVGPPQPEQSVRAEPDEQGRREVGAQHV